MLGGPHRNQHPKWQSIQIDEPSLLPRPIADRMSTAVRLRGFCAAWAPRVGSEPAGTVVDFGVVMS